MKICYWEKQQGILIVNIFIILPVAQCIHATIINIQSIDLRVCDILLSIFNLSPMCNPKA